jgi:hypothetical protein
MLKMLTSLTDQEIAGLKATRRMKWHLPVISKLNDSVERISDQHLDKYNIKTTQEPYIEYQKRPPHDKYL